MSGKVFCSVMICWPFLVFARVPGSISLSVCFHEKIMLRHDFLVSSGVGLGFEGLSPFLFFSGTGGPMKSSLHVNVVETWFVAVWGLCWCNFSGREMAEMLQTE